VFVVSLIPGLVAYAAGAVLWHQLGAFALPLLPFALVGAFLAAVFMLRIVVPRPKAGTYAKPPFALRWQLALEAAGRRAGLHYLLRCFYSVRFLYLRALGGRIAFLANAALDAEMSGVSLLTIGAGLTLALFSSVSTYRIHGAGCVIAPVSIGESAFIGNSAVVGPGCTVGVESFVGVMNRLADGETVADGARIADYARPK
jgi:acetyltransferase-like isoleucine patch superfamily enzyme